MNSVPDEKRHRFHTRRRIDNRATLSFGGQIYSWCSSVHALLTLESRECQTTKIADRPLPKSPKLLSTPPRVAPQRQRQPQTVGDADPERRRPQPLLPRLLPLLQNHPPHRP